VAARRTDSSPAGWPYPQTAEEKSSEKSELFLFKKLLVG